MLTLYKSDKRSFFFISAGLFKPALRIRLKGRAKMIWTGGAMLKILLNISF